jgi:glutamine synthetase
MELLRKVAQRHNFQVLMHEKPFAGINGSGKHNNWSMADDQGNNLLEPGSTPQENTQFLVVLAAVIRAVNKHAKLLRASIAFAGNDHRLGANEAPPAIISVFLGDRLNEIVTAIVEGKPVATKSGKAVIQFGVSHLPQLPRDDSDRNRTSPFAFTGNKFEFRAVGSSQSIAWPNTVLNTIVAESLDYMATEIEKAVKGGVAVNEAAQKVAKQVFTENQRVLFNGDNYSKEWHQEAEKRGLPNLKNTLESLPALIEKEAKELFGKYSVLMEDELVSRYNIMLEGYCKTINIESLLTSSIATTMILPAALEFQNRLATTLVNTKAAIGGINLTTQEGMLRELCNKVTQLKTSLEILESLLHGSKEEEETDAASHAKFYEAKVIPAMNDVRTAADELETIVDDALWPLPKFREMLYIY